MSTLVEESLSVSGILLGKTMGRSPELVRRFDGESEQLAENADPVAKARREHGDEQVGPDMAISRGNEPEREEHRPDHEIHLHLVRSLEREAWHEVAHKHVVGADQQRGERQAADQNLLDPGPGRARRRVRRELGLDFLGESASQLRLRRRLRRRTDRHVGLAPTRLRA